MAKLDPAVLAHLEWLGFVQPVGLVVSAPALVRAGAILERRDAEGQRLLAGCVTSRAVAPSTTPEPLVADFQVFARTVLGWSLSPKGYAGTEASPIPADLELELPDSGGRIRPDFAVREPNPKDGSPPWQLLVQVLETGHDFDTSVRGSGRLALSAHGRMERLLRHTGVPAGLLVNGRALRLLSAPKGENSGWLNFRVADMVQTAGRPISTALRLLLSERRLLTLPTRERLAALLDDSRKFQNEVSERLAEQVLHALYELLRGLQAAHGASGGQLLRQVLADQPDEVYRALLTVILRLVFLLYAEERDMLPEDETFLQHYSLAGLHERLRSDAALYPDTMDQRYGAWAQLVALFRMVHDGAVSGPMHLPRRHGVLFDPDRFKFLEGRSGDGARQIHERIEPPLVPDGTIYRALEKLLVLDGERISYRALDVEQIGSVYETMMGFRLEMATGPSVAIRAQKKQGAPTAVDMEALRAAPGRDREKWLADRTGRKLSDTVKRALVAASSLEDLHAALLPVIDVAATPDVVPEGAIMLQPSEERRRSGSHYTPRSLTEPIVRTTLEPVLARLRGVDGQVPRPEQILDLKVCDPAMGSGAFLVEACRQLGAALVEAWHAHAEVPEIPDDEREDLFAMRLVAQRCLYGVDRNPVAVDLAKVSLWLATLAKEHPLTFVDHSLRHGDSLVGLSRRQIEALHWDESKPILKGLGVREAVDRVSALREKIRLADESVSDWELRDLWDEAQFELSRVRLFGDSVLAAFFEGTTPRQREQKRIEYASAIVRGEEGSARVQLNQFQPSAAGWSPFHWEVEFPEVFEPADPGFGAVVGNPPFLGGRKVRSTLGDSYCDWLPQNFESFSNNADLVAAFFRRAFDITKLGGCIGLIATNTIAQGDTRRSGLRWLRRQGATIYGCVRRLPWPGAAAVVVSVVHIAKGHSAPDGRPRDGLTAFLVTSGGDEDPVVLRANAQKSFQGVVVAGGGFLFDDSSADASTTPLAKQLLREDPRHAEVVRPYIGGEEVNTSPTLMHSRWVIDFSEQSEREAREWPALFKILEEKVLPYRRSVRREAHRRYWWQFGDKRPALRALLRQHERVLVNAQVSQYVAFAFQPTDRVFAMMLNVFVLDSNAAFCTLQSRPHEIWARFFGSSLEDRLRYTPTDCFETFPFPDGWATDPSLENPGRAYYDYRAELMVRNDEGMTKTYNRFHDPQETAPEIEELRRLHVAMDRAVLDAYGWRDIPTECDFLLDFEIDEEEWGGRKKPYRYRWPDEVQDKVLARLLQLNADRAKEEAHLGMAFAMPASKPASKPRKTPKKPGGLF